jgi:hypothetical protein
MIQSWVIVALTLLLPQKPSAAQVTEWAWFRSVSTGTSWWTTDGKAEVNLAGKRFEAKLRDSANPTFVRLSLRGSTSNGVTTARVRVESSDADDFEVSGRLRRLCWGKGGREIIILTNGVDVVGLVRELNESSSCKPA